MDNDDLFIEGYKLPKTLDKEESHALLKKMCQGDEVARDTLIKHNIRLVLYEVTNKFRKVNYDKKDLVSIGNVGLMKAINTFDISKNIEFSSYAIKCIDNEILMFLRQVRKEQKIDSLDEVFYNDNEGNELKFIDILSDDEDFAEDYAANVTYQTIRKIVSELPERDKIIVVMHFGFCNNHKFTQREIATKLKMSQSYVSRLLEKIVSNIAIKLEEQDVIELRKRSQRKKNNNYLLNDNKEEYNKPLGKRMTIYDYLSCYAKEDIDIMLAELTEEEGFLHTLGYIENKSCSNLVNMEKVMTKEDYAETLNVVKNLNFYESIETFSTREILIASLKLGCINDKCFTTSSIAEFLEIDEQEVLTATKKVLVTYKERLDNIEDVATSTRVLNKK